MKPERSILRKMGNQSYHREQAFQRAVEEDPSRDEPVEGGTYWSLEVDGSRLLCSESSRDSARSLGEMEVG